MPVARWVSARAGSVVWVLSHEAPDGDAIGSLLAAGVLLRACGSYPVLLCPDPVPGIYSFLPGVEDILTGPEPGRVAGAHLFLDCAGPERIGGLRELLQPGPPSANIDHHESNTRYADLNWVDPGASSTGEMLARLYCALGVPLHDAAGAIYTAIVTDTGSFAFESTTPQTHRWAAAALRAGVLPGEYHSRIYGSRERAAVALLGRALRSLRFEAGGKIAIMVLRPADFAEAGASREHTEGIVNHARDVAGVKVALLAYSLDGSTVRVAVRSDRSYNAGALAARFGGGGHPRAAGCRLPGPLSRAVELVVSACMEDLGK